MKKQIQLSLLIYELKRKNKKHKTDVVVHVKLSFVNEFCANGWFLVSTREKSPRNFTHSNIIYVFDRAKITEKDRQNNLNSQRHDSRGKE